MSLYTIHICIIVYPRSVWKQLSHCWKNKSNWNVNEYLTEHWHRLSRDVVKSSWGISKWCTGVGLGTLLWVSLLDGAGEGLDGFRGPCQPQPSGKSVIQKLCDENASHISTEFWFRGSLGLFSTLTAQESMLYILRDIYLNGYNKKNYKKDFILSKWLTDNILLVSVHFPKDGIYCGLDSNTGDRTSVADILIINFKL